MGKKLCFSLICELQELQFSQTKDSYVARRYCGAKDEARAHKWDGTPSTCGFLTSSLFCISNIWIEHGSQPKVLGVRFSNIKEISGARDHNTPCAAEHPPISPVRDNKSQWVATPRL